MRSVLRSYARQSVLNNHRSLRFVARRLTLIAKYGGLDNTQYVNELFNTTGIPAR